MRRKINYESNNIIDGIYLRNKNQLIGEPLHHVASIHSAVAFRRTLGEAIDIFEDWIFQQGSDKQSAHHGSSTEAENMPCGSIIEITERNSVWWFIGEFVEFIPNGIFLLLVPAEGSDPWCPVTFGQIRTWIEWNTEVQYFRVVETRFELSHTGRKEIQRKDRLIDQIVFLRPGIGQVILETEMLIIHGCLHPVISYKSTNSEQQSTDLSIAYHVLELGPCTPSLVVAVLWYWGEEHRHRDPRYLSMLGYSCVAMVLPRREVFFFPVHSRTLLTKSSVHNWLPGSGRVLFRYCAQVSITFQ